MAPLNSLTSSYTPWSTGDDGSKEQEQQLVQVEPSGGQFWSSGSSDLEAPAWDIEFSENGPGAWDFDLSAQLAAKLLLIDPTAGTQLPDPNSDGCILGAGTAAAAAAAAALTNPRFKTEFCRNYKEKGTCLYGELCQFAHGRHELRKDVVRHNKYKTKLCQKFWIVGYCAYGPRCNFVHNELDSGNQVFGSGSAGPNSAGNGRFREYHVSYRKSSLGDSGADSGSEHGSVVAAAATTTGTTAASAPLGQLLSPPHIFHPEDNPLPLGSSRRSGGGREASSELMMNRRAWDLAYF